MLCRFSNKKLHTVVKRTRPVLVRFDGGVSYDGISFLSS